VVFVICFEVPVGYLPTTVVGSRVEGTYDLY